MFDRIAGRYDLLNHLLSAGQDWVWRRRLAGAMRRGAAVRVLDLATGTGDQLLALDRRLDLELGIGIDISWGMLHLGHRKLRDRKVHDHLHMVHGDALALPLPDHVVDAVTISFGIRNVSDMDLALREMHRVLKPGGQVYILEFGLPDNRLLRRLYLFYFRHLLPHLGGLLSGDIKAYQYLNKTVETFPYGSDFGAHLERAGFTAVSARPMTFGVAYLYTGTRNS